MNAGAQLSIIPLEMARDFVFLCVTRSITVISGVTWEGLTLTLLNLFICVLVLLLWQYGCYCLCSSSVNNSLLYVVHMLFFLCCPQLLWSQWLPWWDNWLDALTAPNITLQRAKITNPSTLMMTAMFDIQDECVLIDHDCVMLSHSPPQCVSEIPLENPDMFLFTDASAQVLNGCRYAGWTVCSSHTVIGQGCLPDQLSAQVAELVDLTNACILATSCTATIYMNSICLLCCTWFWKYLAVICIFDSCSHAH